MNNFLSKIKRDPLDELKIFSGKFISIGLLARYPERLLDYLLDLESNSYDTKNFEVMITIPTEEEIYKEIKEVCRKTSVETKIQKLPYEYLNSMKCHNLMIKKLSDQNTYFYINNSDRCRFTSKNWDLIIKQYIECVPDHMFFLRGSKFSKNMKYRKSAQEAYYFPEQWGVYSRKYLEATDGFLESHTGHDGPSEMIQYFVSNNMKDPYQRDILMPEIMHSDKRTISSKDTTGGKERFYERYYINNFFYKSYFSKKGLNACNKAAINIYLHHIIWKNNYTDSKIKELRGKLAIELSDGKIIHNVNYKLSYFRYLREKIAYFYGVNHGLNFAHRFYFIIKYKKGFFFMKKIVFFLNSHIQNIKNPRSKKINILPSYFFAALSNFLTYIFFTEPISNELEGLFRGDDFRKVLHGDKIKSAYREKIYKKSLDQIAIELENK